MASWSSASGTRPYITLTVNESGSTSTVAKLAYSLVLTCPYRPSAGSNRTWNINIAGQTRSGSVNINITGSATLATGTVNVTKGPSATNVNVSASLNFDLTWSGVAMGTSTVGGTFPIPATTQTYTVTYWGNNGTGVSGIPAKQTKTHGVTLKLSSSVPSKPEQNDIAYTFLEWRTNNDGTGTKYDPGQNYTANANLTLYGKWRTIWFVYYDANEGTGGPQIRQAIRSDETTTLWKSDPTRTGYSFTGWNTKQNGTGTNYVGGQTVPKGASITLYAQWQLLYTKPRITKVSAFRSDNSNNRLDDGTYANVKFTWDTDDNVTEVKIEWKKITDSTWSSKVLSRTGKTGVESENIGSGLLDPEIIYNIRISVADGTGETKTSTSTINIPAMTYIIDFLSGGEDGTARMGVAFGGPAVTEKTVEFFIPQKLSYSLPVTDNLVTRPLFVDSNNKVVTDDTGWVTANLAASGADNFNLYGATPVRYRKVGRKCYVDGIVTPKNAIDGSATVIPIFILPSIMSPTYTKYSLCQGTGSNKWLLSITASNGVVGFSRYGSTNYAICSPGAWLPFYLEFDID
ncbi:MAG: InlB B-repeat-containing protein [Candidatus Izemoplasmatales bacterium]|nr:InlB B-repeat-containing protein [Candidatus Izemoplasmatales bacterium]